MKYTIPMDPLGNDYSPENEHNPCKDDGWKTIFPLKWSLLRGHSFIFAGVRWWFQAFLVDCPRS